MTSKPQRVPLHGYCVDKEGDETLSSPRVCNKSPTPRPLAGGVADRCVRLLRSPHTPRGLSGGLGMPPVAATFVSSQLGNEARKWARSVTSAAMIVVDFYGVGGLIVVERTRKRTV